jgi:hypothetical protein
MIHKHGDVHNPSAYCQRDGIHCRFNYPHSLCTNTSISSSGHVTYRRRNDVDAWVVPHNIHLLRLLQCHINCEVANTSALFQYLFKYVYKGASSDIKLYYPF